MTNVCLLILMHVYTILITFSPKFTSLYNKKRFITFFAFHFIHVLLHHFNFSSYPSSPFIFLFWFLEINSLTILFFLQFSFPLDHVTHLSFCSLLPLNWAFTGSIGLWSNWVFARSAASFVGGKKFWSWWWTNPISGLDPIGVETAPSDGAVQKVLLPEAAGSASGDFRESLWFASFPFSSFSLLLSLNFSICLLMIALFPLHNSAHECISSVTFFSTLCKLRGSWFCSF